MNGVSLLDILRELVVCARLPPTLSAILRSFGRCIERIKHHRRVATSNFATAYSQ